MDSIHPPMSADPTNPDDSAICDFLDQFLEDEGAQRIRPLSEYLRRFPGHEEAIAREFIDLVTERRQSGGGRPGDALRTTANRPPLDDYVLIRELGRGGQGSVYLAEDPRLKRKVALKVLEGPVGRLSTARRERFRREAEVLSRLEHPGICTIYSAQLDCDQPFIAMRFVPGLTLDEWARGQAFGDDVAVRTEPIRWEWPRLATVLSIFESVARALHAAHAAGVIHRDIKPANVMVTPEGSPVILDFGLARHDDNVTVSRAGNDLLGTLAYMAPEVIRGAARPDAACDVYALGVCLMEAVCGCRPYAGPTEEALLASISTGPARSVKSTGVQVSRDVALVIETAIERDRHRRYATAEAFAEDLRRVRAQEPIRARPVPPVLRVLRWIQRRPAVAAAFAVAFLATAVGLVIALHLLDRVTSEETARVAETDRLRALEDAYSARIVAEEHPTLALRMGLDAARRSKDTSITNILYDLMDRCFEKRVIEFHDAAPPIRLRLAVSGDGRQIFIVRATGELRGADTETGELLPWASGIRNVTEIAVDAPRSRLLLGHLDGSVEIDSLTDGHCVTRWAPPPEAGRQPSAVRHIAISPTGATVAICDQAGTIALRRSAQADAAPTLCERTCVAGTLQFSPDDRWLAVFARDDAVGSADAATVLVFDVATGRQVRSQTTRSVGRRTMAWLPDGRQVAFGTDDGEICFLAVEGETHGIPLRHDSPVQWLGVHPDGRQVVTGTREGAVVWDLSKGSRVAVVDGFHERSVIAGAFSADGRDLCVLSWDQTGAIVDCATWKRRRTLKGHLTRPLAVAWPAGRSEVVTLEEGGTAHVWHAGFRPQLPQLERPGARILDIQIHRKRPLVLVRASDGHVVGWDFVKNEVVWDWADSRGFVAARFDALGDHVLLATAATLEVRATGDGSVRMSTTVSSPIVDAAFAPTRDLVVTTHSSGRIALWEPQSGRLVHEFVGHDGTVGCMAFHPSEPLLATGGDDGHILLVDLAAMTIRRLWESPRGRSRTVNANLDNVSGLCFSAAHASIIASCDDGMLRQIALSGDSVVEVPRGPTPGALAMARTQDRLLLGDRWAGGVRFVDPSDIRRVEATILLDKSHMLAAIGFSDDDRFIYIASRDSRVRILAADGSRQHAVIDSGSTITSATVTPDARMIAVGTVDGLVRLFPLDPVSVAERYCPIDEASWGRMKDSVRRTALTR